MFITLVGAIAVLGLAACGGTVTPTGTPTPTNPTQVVETPTGVTPTALVEKPTAEPTPVVQSTPEGWSTFTSDAGGFSVAMPGEPQASTQTADSDYGEISFLIFQLADGHVQYAVTYNDYPSGLPADALEPDVLLEKAIEGAARGGEANEVQRVEVQGNPAVQAELDIPGQAHAWYMGILVGERLYQLIAAVPPGEETRYATEAQRFIDSFRLLEQ